MYRLNPVPKKLYRTKKQVNLYNVYILRLNIWFYLKITLTQQKSKEFSDNNH